MDYQNAWEELSHKLNDAEVGLLVIRNRGGATNSEKKRIDLKLEGLRMAKEYIKEIETSIDGPIVQ